jgi:hypothetical protein
MGPESSSPLETLRRLYFEATERTIARDFQHAIEILKTLPTEEERERAAVFMDGLSQMRSEWVAAGKVKIRRQAR